MLFITAKKEKQPEYPLLTEDYLYVFKVHPFKGKLQTH